MSIIYKEDKYNIKSFMNLVNFMTVFIIPPFEFVIQVECADQDLAAFCLNLLKSLLCNIHLVYFQNISAVRTKEEEYSAYNELFKVMEAEINACKNSAAAMKETYINQLRDVLGLKKCRKKAVLNSMKGMHVVHCTQLRLISTLLNCRITLDCTNKNNEPQSCDIADMMGILNLSIPNGSVIYVNSEGKNCEEAAGIVKYILEHIDTTLAEWQTCTSHIEKEELGKNLLAFIRSKMQKK